MTPPKIYKSPGAFKQAFDRRHSHKPRALVIIMERFAARVCEEFDGAVVKGGRGLELRLKTPRTTKDADLIVSGSTDLETRLTQAGQLDFGDYLKFAVMPASGHEFKVSGMAYAGKRYDVRAFFASGPPWPDKQILTSDIGFENVMTKPIRVYGIHDQIAEKLHAYTDPRHRNTDNKHVMRPRDLLDLCRCASSERVTLNAERLRTSIVGVFTARKAVASDLHDVPERLPEMPTSWHQAFTEQVTQSQLPWQDPVVAHQLASQFINPVLAGTATGSWNPTTRCGE